MSWMYMSSTCFFLPCRSFECQWAQSHHARSAMSEKGCLAKTLCLPRASAAKRGAGSVAREVEG
eukprot:839007-Alexandrium_andersonii.AAC.1